MESKLNSNVGAYALAKQGVYNADVVEDTFNEAVAYNLRNEKFKKLKEGNELVYFQLGNEIALATVRNDIFVIGKLTYVYLDGKQIQLTDLNGVTKRSRFFYDMENSDVLSKKFGKETLSFTTSVASKATVDNSFKTTLIINVNN